jgi:phosphoribosylformimino-5-aminoimidazole carboxamide ribotide isomerase
MVVIPVLDILNGIVVHGVAGQRDQYRPLVSDLTPSSDPVVIANALAERFEFPRFYIADLDGIIHGRPSHLVYKNLMDQGFLVYVDNGARTEGEVHDLVGRGAWAILGLESWPDLKSLPHVAREYDAEVFFSLDLKSGRPIHGPGWTSDDPLKIAEDVIGAGIYRLIVLDVAAVGTSAGIPTLPLCKAIKDRWPDVELTTGGGVRSADDLYDAKAAGLNALLVATALHNGSLDPEVVREFSIWE